METCHHGLKDLPAALGGGEILEAMAQQYQEGQVYDLAGEKSFLQTIKMEISKTFKLVPYERIAFHKILSILKTDNGKNILLKELDKGPHIRFSSIESLSHFDSPEVLQAFTGLLQTDLPEHEVLLILDYISKNGGDEQVPALKEIIENQKKDNPSVPVITTAFDALRNIGKNNEEIRDYLLSLIKDQSLDKNIIFHAVIALSAYQVIFPFEEVLRGNDESLTYAVYRGLYLLSAKLVEEQSHASDATGLYTYSTENEDKSILDLRVLLGKMSSRFDSYSNRVKVAFVSVMIMCNHREFLVYVMKSLTSRNQELTKMVLYSIHSNIQFLKDPDKLLRSLIALSTETDEENDLIVDIFIKYFSQRLEGRHFNILKDKLYNYIVVTLESYFETYRKEFMIPEVIEKSYPETFQHLRKFILEKFTPELKKKIVHFLLNEDKSAINHLFIDMAKWVKFISPEQEEDLGLLLQILYDGDTKSRENSAARIDDLRYEKRYLRNRIVRLCKIIEGLSINEASSTLVNIYNYLKKYPDKDLLSATIHALSMLNYSYMLGEIEVMLTTGSEADQRTALSLLSLFHEQRSMNIIIDYLKEHLGEPSFAVKTLINILLERDISGNATINDLFKKTIDVTDDSDIRQLCIMGIGKCGLDNDIEYLNDLFFHINKDEPKDSIVRAIGSIISLNRDINKRTLKKVLNDYLKDPSIKVRIYSCLLLVKLGDKDALRAIRDMLIIKNKSIQRDILMVLGELRSVEFSFFLVSLLKEEYSISGDIIPIISSLPVEDLKEIDGFVVNIFRKFDTTDLDVISAHRGDDQFSIPGLKNETATVLSLDLFKLKDSSEYTFTELIDLNTRLKTLISSLIESNGGVITQVSNRRILSYFRDHTVAAETSLAISQNFKDYNDTRVSSRQISIQIQLFMGQVRIINDEIIEYPRDVRIQSHSLPFSSDIICNTAFTRQITDNYITVIIPDILFTGKALVEPLTELISPLNFTKKVEQILEEIIKDEEEKKKMALQIEAEMKRLRSEHRPKASMSIASELEDIGQQIKAQLDSIDQYVQRRTTDRELIKNVRKMLKNTHDYYKVEISRFIVD